METSFVTHTSVDSIHNEIPVLYYDQSYLNNQAHANFVCYENDYFVLPLAIDKDFAISIPRSPFGSFFVKDNCNVDEFLQFVDQVKKDLESKQVQTLRINHPSEIYQNFAEENWLASAGFKKEYEDINQQIRLKADWVDSIHEMQKRKLVSLKSDGFEFKKMDISELETAHQFIKVCRLAQELEINIPFERLQELSSSTKAYDIFGVYREDKISSLCIAVRVTKNVAYYYLPATSPMFRSQSPMVLLIAGMVGHYQSQGFDYFDMGISSIEGKVQESLRIFKERMGATQSGKPTFSLQI